MDDSTPVSAAAPDGALRMRYWKPAHELAGLISGYHLYAVPRGDGVQKDVLQPAWGILRFMLGEAAWRARPPGGDWIAIEGAVLFGPSSGVTWSESAYGCTVGIGILPRGWARLVTDNASAWSNKIGPAGRVVRGDLKGLVSELSEISDEDEVPAAFDRFLLGAMASPPARDAAMLAVEAALVDPEVASVADLAARCGLGVRTLERLAARAFGFPPKLLLRRTRFIRSLHAVASAAPAERAAAIDPAYTDYSHFVRDAQDFLGMSPGAFLKLDNPLFRRSLAMRTKVLGAPAQALAPPVEQA